MDNPDKAAKKLARITGNLNGVKDNYTISRTTGSAGSSRSGTPLAGNASLRDMLAMLSGESPKSKEELANL